MSRWYCSPGSGSSRSDVVTASFDFAHAKGTVTVSLAHLRYSMPLPHRCCDLERT